MIFFIEEFMVGYVALSDVYMAYFTGDLDSLGIDPATFSLSDNMQAAMNALGRF